MRIILVYESLLSYSPLGLVSTVSNTHHSTHERFPSRFAAPHEVVMAILPLRTVRLPTATEQFYDGWLADLEAQLAEPGADWYRLTRDLLFQIYHPATRDYDTLLQSPATAEATRVALLSLDPWNVTLEPEYYAEVDPHRFARVKPLLWLWQGFDRSPIAHNVHLGVRFRRLLANHIFARVGRNFKAFQYVEFSFGYNLEVGDDVVVHRNCCWTTGVGSSWGTG